MQERSDLGSSMTARTFGARVGLTMPDQGLYLVIGRSPALSGLVRGAGGEVVLQLSALKLLVILPVTAYLGFRGHRDIAFIGPVSLDHARYAQFATRLARGTSPDPGGEIT